MRLLICIWFTLSCVVSTESQSISYFDYLDSLKHVLKTSQDAVQRIEAASEIGVRYIYANPDSTIKYCELALSMLEDSDDLNAKLYALGIMGESYIYKGNFPKTLEIGYQALDLNGETPFTISFMGPTLYNLSELYFQIEDYDKALDYAQEMIRNGRNHRDIDKLGEAYGYYLSAQVYEKLGYPDSALANIELSFPIFKEHGDPFFKTVYGDDVWPGVYNLRAKVYLQQGRKELAMKDLIKVSQMTGGSNEYYHISNTNIDVARYFQNIGEPDSTIYFAEKGLEAAKEISYNQGILNASKLLAQQFESTDPEKALEYLKLSTDTQSKLYGSGNIQAIRDLVNSEEQRREDLEQAENDYRNKLTSTLLWIGIGFLVVISLILYLAGRRSEASRKILSKTLDNLKTTQAQLIHAEKMASLGELTAGIAHEIQNPLNFVNNFSEVNSELIDELVSEIDRQDWTEVKAIAKDIKANESKISQHGKRADGIVKSMLQHSRESQGEKQPTDINMLADEYLRLAYHGMQAKDKSFNAHLETRYDQTLSKINVIPQEIGRVLLNLITNAFQVMHEKKNDNGTSYVPTLLLSTQSLKDQIQIKIADNGSGIPDDIMDKIFQPFFTTKPTGEGTGLGLSLSYDIIKTHGGELKVESKQNQGAEFTILLPIKSQ